MNERLEAATTVQDVAGFKMGTAQCGLKRERPDLMVLRNDGPHPAAAAVFTRNTFAAAPVHVSRQHMAGGDIRGLVVNAGLANACTGRQGLRDALTMARTTGDAMGLAPEQVLVASTGIIGRPLPMQKITRGIWDAAEDLGNGNDAPCAILTTDSGPKTAQHIIDVDGHPVTIKGFAKGSGMIHPDMATMLAFVLTDAHVDQAILQDALREATNQSFNQISVDGDPSTNDMAAAFASGASDAPPIVDGTANAATFVAAIVQVCRDLAMQIAADGEGASRFLEAKVTGASCDDVARKASRAVISSFLVKAAAHGADANWGRILAAAGSTAMDVNEDALDLHVSSARGTSTVIAQGAPTGDNGREAMDASCVRIHLNVGDGPGSGHAWGCDVSPESVSFNAEKTT